MFYCRSLFSLVIMLAVQNLLPLPQSGKKIK